MKWMLAVGMAPGHFWINLKVKNAASWCIICHKGSKGDACFARNSKICHWQDVSISMNDHWWFHYMETNGPVLCNGTRCFAHQGFVMILARATYAWPQRCHRWMTGACSVWWSPLLLWLSGLDEIQKTGPMNRVFLCVFLWDGTGIWWWWSPKGEHGLLFTEGVP